MAHEKTEPRKPRITDRVIFRHRVNSSLDHPAIVTRVVEGTVVNLHVIFDGGAGTSYQSRVHYDASAEPKANTWRWPEK
jgi:hypothetical protein